MSKIEQTLSIIKPDAVERNLDNEIKEMFKNKGFRILKEKKIQIEKNEAEKFYKVHETKPFYNDLCSYLSLISNGFDKCLSNFAARISTDIESTLARMLLTQNLVSSIYL